MKIKYRAKLHDKRVLFTGEFFIDDDSGFDDINDKIEEDINDKITWDYDATGEDDEDEE